MHDVDRTPTKGGTDAGGVTSARTITRRRRTRGALRGLRGAELHEGARELAKEERGLVLGLLFYLDEIDRRRDYDGCGTLWRYCAERLRLPEHAIFLRTKAVALIRRYPDAIPRLRDGRLNLSTLVALRKVLTRENASVLFDAVDGRTKKDAVAIAAMARARVVPRSSVRVVPAQVLPVPEPIARMRSEEPMHRNAESRPATDGAPAIAGLAALDGLPVESGVPVNADTIPAGVVPATDALTPGDAASANGVPGAWLVFSGENVRDLLPVSATQCQVTFTAPIEFRRELDELREGLSHIVPDGDLAAVVQYAVREVLTRLRKKNGAAAVRERRERGAAVPECEGGAVAACDATGSADANATGNEIRRGDAGGEIARDAVAGGEFAAGKLAEGKIGRAASKNGEPVPAGNEKWTRRDAAGAGNRRIPVPARLRRAVMARDDRSCQFPLPGGGVCGSRWQCEVDHIEPVARGGETVLGNLRVVCRRHNLEAERRAFGDEFVDRKIRERRASAARSDPDEIAGGAGRDPP